MSEVTANIEPIEQTDKKALRLKYKYKKSVTNKIYKLLSTKKHSIRELCKIVSISESVFYLWRNEIEEFRDLLEKAESVRFDSILAMCETKLEDLANGYEYEETKTIFEMKERKDGTGTLKKEAVIKEQIVVTKHIKPDLGAIIHLQTNLDPEKWKNRQSVESNNTNKNLNANFVINMVDAPVPLRSSEEEVDLPDHIKKADIEDAEFIEVQH